MTARAVCWRRRPKSQSPHLAATSVSPDRIEALGTPTSWVCSACEQLRKPYFAAARSPARLHLHSAWQVSGSRETAAPDAGPRSGASHDVCRRGGAPVNSPSSPRGCSNGAASGSSQQRGQRRRRRRWRVGARAADLAAPVPHLPARRRHRQLGGALSLRGEHAGELTELWSTYLNCCCCCTSRCCCRAGRWRPPAHPSCRCRSGRTWPACSGG